MMLRIVKRTWAILTWTPIKSWHGNAFNFLWTIGALAAIVLAVNSDDTWNYKTQDTEDQQEYEVELTIEEWNAQPLYLGDGSCMIIKTRQIISC